VSSVSVAHRDSGIEGLRGTRGGLARDGVMVVGVDSVIDDSSDVVGSDSIGPMGEGAGRDKGMDLMDLTDSAEESGGTGTTTGGSGSSSGSSSGSGSGSGLSSVGRTDGVDTDSGSRILLGIIVVETDGMLSMSEGELVEERSSG